MKWTLVLSLFSHFPTSPKHPLFSLSKINSTSIVINDCYLHPSFLLTPLLKHYIQPHFRPSTHISDIVSCNLSTCTLVFRVVMEQLYIKRDEGIMSYSEPHTQKIETLEHTTILVKKVCIASNQNSCNFSLQSYSIMLFFSMVEPKLTRI